MSENEEFTISEVLEQFKKHIVTMYNNYADYDYKLPIEQQFVNDLTIQTLISISVSNMKILEGLQEIKKELVKLNAK